VTAATAAAKRGLDVLVAAALLLALAPLLVWLALAVRLDSRGPALFRAERAGRGGRPFSMLKLRTMRLGAAQGGAVTAPRDARVTRLGRFLRAFKLDELPQLVNVLRGEMSLVGPRPEDPGIVRDHYTEAQRRVLDVRPGMTGLSQVTFYPDMSALVPPGQDAQAYYRDVQLPQKLAVELRYVERASIAYDLVLLGRTAWCVLMRSWAALYHPREESR